MVLDRIVIQVTDNAHGGSSRGGEERSLVQQDEIKDDSGSVTQAHKAVNVTYASMPSAEKAAFDTLKAYCQTQLDA